MIDDNLDFMDDDDIAEDDFDSDPGMKVRVQKMAAQRKREISDKLEMLKWKREYGLSDEDFQQVLSDY